MTQPNQIKTIHLQAYRGLIAELRQARLRAGITQVDAGVALGRSRQWICKTESCEIRLDVVQFVRLSQGMPGCLIDCTKMQDYHHPPKNQRSAQKGNCRANVIWLCKPEAHHRFQMDTMPCVLPQPLAPCSLWCRLHQRLHKLLSVSLPRFRGHAIQHLQQGRHIHVYRGSRCQWNLCSLNRW